MTAERDKLKAMPMKYRRLQFNAELQQERDAAILGMRTAELRESAAIDAMQEKVGKK